MAWWRKSVGAPREVQSPQRSTAPATFDGWVFPEPDEGRWASQQLHGDELRFYQVQDELDRGTLKRVPGCVGLAQGLLPSQSDLASGPLSFGGFTIAVGAEAMHLHNVKQVRELDLGHYGEWLLDNFGATFAEHQAGFLRFDFHPDRARSADSFIVGFAKREVLVRFANLYASNFGVAVSLV